MKNLYLIMIALMLSWLTVVASKLSIDTISLITTSTFQCMKNSDYTSATIRALFNRTGIDPSTTQNLANAKNAGLSTDIYIQPCRSRAPSQQIQQLMQKIPRELYDMVWIQPDTQVFIDDYQCTWFNHTAEDNCQYLKELIEEVRKYGVTVGVNPGQYWPGLVGKDTCVIGPPVKLWWYHPDGNATYSGFQPFSGWYYPDRKQYKILASLCGKSTLGFSYTP